MLNANRVNARMALYSRVRRRRIDISSVFAQDVTHAAHRLNQAGFAAGLRFCAEIADVDVEHVSVAGKVVTPDPPQNPPPRQTRGGREKKKTQQINFRGRGPKSPPAPPRLAGDGI